MNATDLKGGASLEEGLGGGFKTPGAFWKRPGMA
jgi:hypothetical protein